MKKNIESTYGKALKGLMFAVNPVKKKVLKTHCIVHKFINLHAIDILKNEEKNEAYDFYKSHVKGLNHGVTWADQDFKSSNHFYHYEHGKGLYGFSDAYTECNKYYKKALAYMEAGDIEKSIFFLGAACHLVQDTTVPQHVNNKLLKSHRKFELWIIARLMTDYSFALGKKIKRYDTLKEYINNNAVVANNCYIKYREIRTLEERYSKIASTIIKEAQETTAGLLLDFFERNNEFIKNSSI
jgi:Zinc dependent phospholipase C.